MSLLSSLTTIRYYTAADPYFYSVDNRPLTDVSSSLVTVATYIDTGLYASPLLSTTATGGVGYATGAGGSQSQLTDKSTTVILNKITGRITMNSATLNANTTVSFTLTNSAIASTDLVLINHVSGGTAGSYTVNAQAAGGSATINVRNITGGNLGEAIVLGFAVIKSVIT